MVRKKIEKYAPEHGILAVSDRIWAAPQGVHTRQAPRVNLDHWQIIYMRGSVVDPDP